MFYLVVLDRSGHDVDLVFVFLAQFIVFSFFLPLSL